MKIRQKITLWIAATALVAALGFAAFVFVEFLDEPGKLIDAELEQMAVALVTRNTGPDGRLAGIDPRRLPYPPDLYWITVRDSRGRLCYRSALAALLDIPGRAVPAYYFEKTVPREVVQIGQDEHDEVTFRVNERQVPVDGEVYTVRIAKPVEFLEEELRDLVLEVAAGIATFTMILLVVSHFVAGRILAPIGAISSLAREITGRTLGRRIPVADSRDELAELARTLNLMFDRLEHSFARQKRFLAAAAHEMKSPVSLMILAQEEMLRRQDLPDTAREEAGRLLDVMRRLKLLLNRLLDLSRLELCDELDLQDIDPGRLVTGVLDEYREMIGQRGIGLETAVEDGLVLHADPGEIRQVVINLVDNAVRYNVVSGRIRVSLEEEDGEVVLRVGNSGPGIPAEDIGRVFEQFYRVEKSRAAGLGGSGLGLTIARRIVELHRGSIRVDSRPGEWTTVEVRLPSGG